MPMRAGDFRAMTSTSNDCRGEAGTKALKAADSRQQTAQINVLAGHDLRNKFRQNWRNAGPINKQLISYGQSRRLKHACNSCVTWVPRRSGEKTGRARCKWKSGHRGGSEGRNEPRHNNRRGWNSPTCTWLGNNRRWSQWTWGHRGNAPQL